jgi:hypothetical protein
MHYNAETDSHARDPYVVEHLCRRCGERTRSQPAPKWSVIYAIGNALIWRTDRNAQELRGVTLLQVHACADGGMGVADLIGGDPVR